MKPKPKPAEPAKDQGKTAMFSLTSSAGRAVFGSRLEADAANQRAGGQGVVREVR